MTARKEGLERSHPVIALSQQEAARLLRPVLRSATVEAVELLEGGLGNSNYLVRCADAAAVVIRLHAKGRASRDLELAVLKMLRGRIPVPRVLDAGDDAGGSCAYSVVEYCRGQLLNDWLPRADAGDAAALGRAVGETLAAIAAMEFERPGLLGPDLAVGGPVFAGPHPYLDVFDACLGGQAGAALGPALSDRVRRFVGAQRDAIEALSLQRRLVHCDFDGTNVLVERRGDGFAVSGVIDWEFALSGPPIIDLSSMLRYPENLPPGFEAACVEGFVAAGGELAEPWPVLVRVIDLLAFCLFLNKADAINRRRIYDTALRATDGKLRAMGF